MTTTRFVAMTELAIAVCAALAPTGVQAQSRSQEQACAALANWSSGPDDLTITEARFYANRAVPAGPGPGGATPSSSALPAGDATMGAVTPTTTEPPSLPPGERMPASWRPCDNPPAGYSIGYPSDWYTATLDGQFACSFFHPEPFTIPANSEFPRVALQAGQTDETVAGYRDQVTDPAVPVSTNCGGSVPIACS